MSAADSKAQPYEGQHRQQRHMQRLSSNNHRPVPDPGAVWVPDSQRAFTFAAEPASMVYNETMISIPSSSTLAQESLFSPNPGSSFDSTLHPDTSHTTSNLYAQTQNYSLSPASCYASNGQGVSPSHSGEHLSPEGGYMSDPVYHDNHSYMASNFNNHLLDDFSGLTFADNASANPLSPYHETVDMSLLTSNNLNTYHAQLAIPPNAISTHGQNQLVSSCVTNKSSPALAEDDSAISAMNYAGAYSTPPNHTSLLRHATPTKQMQSPAPTNGPGSTIHPNPRSHVRQLTSPIVRVENYGREASPSRSDNSRPVSKRSRGSRRSVNHLSPYPENDPCDGEENREQVQVWRGLQAPERDEADSWLAANRSGRAGLSPEERQMIRDAWVPTIEEIAEQRLKQEKKLEVQEWLIKSVNPITGRRRAKSTNDANRQGLQRHLSIGLQTHSDHFDDSKVPGPGLYIDERSEYDDYDDDDDEHAEPESPPAALDVQESPADGSYVVPPDNSVPIVGAIVRPWIDVPSQSPSSCTRYQPPTSNAAMMRFRLRANDVESASLAATVGSRRLSESDLGSLRASPGVSRLIGPSLKKSKDRQRRPSFLENILPKRTPVNLLKRKGSTPVPAQPDVGVSDKPKEPILGPKRIGSWGRPKSPRVDTNLSNHSRDGTTSSSTGLTAPSGPWYQGAKNAIKRSRSRSDLGRSLGLAELMTQHGGPPMPMLASPLAETEATKAFAQPSPAGDEDDEEQEAITMNLKVRTDLIIPSYEGFRTHARQLNPRLADLMVERVTQEQMRRYKRLLEFRVEHLNAVKGKSCSSGGFCPSLGGKSKQLSPRAGNKDAEAPFIGFQITAPGSSDEDGGEAPAEGTVISAQFPPGVPLPPVKRLPAEFECPLCFKVKKFYKPSDWTKHVHEDVQPFTCTFPNCGEPKSFKRKADWVRHENERHRQLENWTCQMADCKHTCYRKDNFVQHLVREHKIAEPRQRTGRAANKEATAGNDQDDIWAVVERCRRDTSKQPRDEPCRFCGNICNSWKKLTVHLAKHMEQISMPILPLVEQKQLDADSVISPIPEMPENRRFSATPNRSPVDGVGRYSQTSTLTPGIDLSGLYPHDTNSEVASNTMHPYAPPQMVQPSTMVDYTARSPSACTSQTCPGLQVPPKPRVGYDNELHMTGQQYLTRAMPGTVSQYNMSPVSTVQQQQSLYPNSPIDTTSFPSYYTQEPQSLADDFSSMSYDDSNTRQYQQGSTYPAMSYLTTQHNYQYQ